MLLGWGLCYSRILMEGTTNRLFKSWLKKKSLLPTCNPQPFTKRRNLEESGALALCVLHRQMTCVALAGGTACSGSRRRTDTFLVFTWWGVLQLPSFLEMGVWRGINRADHSGCVEIWTSWPAALDPEQKRMFTSILLGRRELNSVYQEEAASWFKIE